MTFDKELINLFGNQKKDEGRPKSDLITAQVSQREQERNKKKNAPLRSKGLFNMVKKATTNI